MAAELSGAEALRRLYPVFETLPATAFAELMAGLRSQRLPKGTVLFDERSPCQAFPLLIEGSVKVAKVAANGREIVLYRVAPGEACVLTSGCLLGRREYPARGVAEADTVLAALPQAQFDRLMAQHAPFREFVFQLFSERLAEMMTLVEAVAFQQLDQRLAALLLGKGREVHATHQGLAAELGSVREIVTRLLRHFAEQGLVSLGRERIEILDAAALRRIASSAR
jgi:CRP/FNR family transcriptional regulator